MSDGRKTKKNVGGQNKPKDDSKRLDKEWDKISKVCTLLTFLDSSL